MDSERKVTSRGEGGRGRKEEEGREIERREREK